MNSPGGGRAAEASAVYREIGHRIRLARKRAGWTQEQLAARLGLLRTSVANIEGGRQAVQVHVLLAMADALGLEPVALLPERPTPGQEGDVGAMMPGELDPSERAWVRRVLGLEMEGRGDDMDADDGPQPS